MSKMQQLKHIAAYPGTLIFALTWAWESRNEAGHKGFVQRMIDAEEDAMELVEKAF